MNSRTLYRYMLLSLALLLAGWRPAAADAGHARIIRLSLVQGDVRFARDVHGDPLTSDKAVWEGATLNLPIRQGYVLATDQGRAEVEFENGAMAFLAENTVLEFYDLSLEDGAKTTRLVLRQGTASFYVNPSSADYFSVTGGDFTVEADGRAGFRLDNFDDGSVVDVTKGGVHVVRKNKTTVLVKGQSLSMRADDKDSTQITRLPDNDDFDRWVSKREEAVTSATAAAGQYMGSTYYSSGMADLYTYGSWYPVSGYGDCWRPYGVGLGWSPFSAGGWFMDPAFGWSFIGSQPWGWLPYHFGGWVFDPVFGWLWSPGFGFGGFGYGGIVPFRPVTGVFVRSKNGLLGLVPAHPLDARGKEPINMAKGIFPVAGGAVSQQALAGESAAQSWKVMKAPPRESLTNTAVAISGVPMRVSRTILAGGGNARVVTLDRNSAIVYDAREHRFVNGASASQNASARVNEQGVSTKQNLPGERVTPMRTEAGSRTLPTRPLNARTSAPPARAMMPPPARASSGSRGWSGGGWGEGGRSRGSAGSRGAATSSSAGAGSSHPSSGGGGGRPH
ncbi:MAG TPA: FecR family protein [Candidatus Acidoferrum sp.]|nr:FecR family protein [Candidatus Acidoferrum sp.]